MKKVLAVCAALLFSSPAWGYDEGKFLDLCMSGTPEQIQEAIKAGAKANAPFSSKKPLMIEGGTVPLMIATDAPMTPLIFAAENNPDPAVIEVLVKAGGNINVVSDFGWTPFFHAASTNTVEMLRELIKRGANPKYISKDGFSAMHVVVENPNVDVIDFLVSIGLDVNLKAKDGDTPLWGATIFGEDNNLENMRRLIKLGANVNAKSFNGKTALWWATESELAPTISPEKVKILREAGAK